MTISESHQRSLMRAGIGQRYIRKEFADLKDGDRYSQETDVLDATQIKNGKGILFVGGPSVTADTVFYLAAKRMHLSGIGCRVTTLPTLVRAVSKDAEVLHEWMDTSALYIDGFYVKRLDNTCPFRPYEMVYVEDFLKDRISKDRPIFLKSSVQVSAITGWWSDDFVQLVSDVTLTVRVD